MLKVLIFLLFLAFLSLQYRLWVGEGSYAEVMYLKKEIKKQRQALVLQQQINQKLSAEIADLKEGLDAVEERARNELGMIKKGETYFQIVEPETGNNAQ